VRHQRVGRSRSTRRRLGRSRRGRHRLGLRKRNHLRLNHGKSSRRRLGRSRRSPRRLGKRNRLNHGKSNRRRLRHDHNRRLAAKQRTLPHRRSLVIRRRRPQGPRLSSPLMVAYRYGIRRSLRRPNKAS
jgi:hypothetical protein